MLCCIRIRSLHSLKEEISQGIFSRSEFTPPNFLEVCIQLIIQIAIPFIVLMGTSFLIWGKKKKKTTDDQYRVVEVNSTLIQQPPFSTSRQQCHMARDLMALPSVLLCSLVLFASSSTLPTHLAENAAVLLLHFMFFQEK